MLINSLEKKKTKMAKKIIQDVVVKINKDQVSPRENIKPAQAREEIKKTEERPVEKPTEPTVKPVEKTIEKLGAYQGIPNSDDKLEQNPFFKQRKEMQEKEGYLPPEWSEELSGGSKSKKIFKWLLILGTIGFVFFAVVKIVSVFSTVNIKLTPKQQALEVKTDLVASAQEKVGSLHLETAMPDVSECEKIASIPGTSQEELQQRATGVVVIFNNNSKAQSLVTETRLESSEGKIYKTDKKLSIPAKGSIEVNVFADQPSKEYNVDLTDFKIPGFKGSAKYETVFGRSKTAITGGYIGQAATLSDADFNKAQGELRIEISKCLKDSIEKDTPANLLLYTDGIKIEFASSTTNPKVGDLGKPFEIKESAITAKAYLLNKEELTQKITETYKDQLLPQSAQGFDIAGLNKLKFAFKNFSEDGEAIGFTLTGNATFVWNVDQDSLINELRNTSSANFKGLLNKHPEIESAEITFSPSWWKIMPKDDSRIKYEEILPKIQ